MLSILMVGLGIPGISEPKLRNSWKPWAEVITDWLREKALE